MSITQYFFCFLFFSWNTHGFMSFSVKCHLIDCDLDREFYGALAVNEINLYAGC